MVASNVAKQWIRFRGFYGTDPMLLQIRVPPQRRKLGLVFVQEEQH